MRFLQVRNYAKEAIDRLTERLLRDFPERQGEHAVVFGQGPEVDLGSKYYDWQQDPRPDFVKEAEAGWVKVSKIADSHKHDKP